MKRISQLLAARGLTVDDLAALVGYRRETVAAFFSGAREPDLGFLSIAVAVLSPDRAQRKPWLSR